MILLKLILKAKTRRNPNNESPPSFELWRNGSHVGTLIFRNCFATMDEKGLKRLPVQTAVIKVTSPALTVPTAWITARNAWLLVIVSCPSIASGYVILSHQQRESDLFLALDRFVL